MEGEVAYSGAAMGALSAVWFGLSAGLYLLAGFAFMKIAERVGASNGWWAFIPVLNIVLIMEIAGKPAWWTLLMFVPVANLVVGIMALMRVAERCGRPEWWGVLIALIPVVNIAMLCIMAFGQPPGGSYSSAERHAA